MIVFFMSAVVLVYVYIGYPLVVIAAAACVKKPVGKKTSTPFVTMIISAYNEEKVIDKKIANTIALNYPKEHLEIIVVSDGSTDRTDQMVHDAGIRLLRIEGRQGKTHCQNQAVDIARGEIIVFSDANSMYESDAISQLVANFSDPQVGVVCGELRYDAGNDTEEGLYWKIEVFLKYSESVIDSCLGANGAIYGIRKSLYIKIPDHAGSDFVEPFMAYRQGYRVIYDAGARCVECPVSLEQELRRKERIILGTLQSIPIIADFLNPFRYGWYSIALWSHKIIRWFTFVFLVLLAVSNIFLISSPLFMALFGAQVLFYLFAGIGLIVQHRLFTIPYYFVILQIASMRAAVGWVRGRRAVIWTTIR